MKEDDTQGEEKDEMEFDEENGEEEDEIEYEIFYEHDAIKETYKCQKDDPFLDILGEKEDSEALKMTNKFDIDKFAPHEELPKASAPKRGGMGAQYLDSEGPTEEEILREAERLRKLKEEQRKEEKKAKEKERAMHNAEADLLDNAIKEMVKEIEQSGGGSRSASKKGSQSSKRSMASSSRKKH
uniref:Uncharacterized protein n=1 Tax=Strombidium inclinatum TaxID=197538 RepID=A0A7S3IQL3_9SPIT|mmetsp:Transcript_34166/g.52437  ORF Transcript_34166/g.52437 Transcript_34166/m.52437 type:complete len:184 (+) Transcript_34166:1260-1811(+)